MAIIIQKHLEAYDTIVKIYQQHQQQMQEYTQKILGSGKHALEFALPNNTTLRISNDKKKDIIEIV